MVREKKTGTKLTTNCIQNRCKNNEIMTLTKYNSGHRDQRHRLRFWIGLNLRIGSKLKFLFFFLVPQFLVGVGTCQIDVDKTVAVNKMKLKSFWCFKRCIRWCNIINSLRMDREWRTMTSWNETMEKKSIFSLCTTRVTDEIEWKVIAIIKVHVRNNKMNLKIVLFFSFFPKRNFNF